MMRVSHLCICRSPRKFDGHPTLPLFIQRHSCTWPKLIYTFRVPRIFNFIANHPSSRPRQILTLTTPQPHLYYIHYGEPGWNFGKYNLFPLCITMILYSPGQYCSFFKKSAKNFQPCGALLSGDPSLNQNW